MPEPAAPETGFDMAPDEFRRHGYQVVDRIAEYLAAPGRWPVLPLVQPGDLRAALPDSAPEDGEPWTRSWPITTA